MEEHEKDDLEKKDKSDPRINYRDDWAETHGSRKEAANEKSNQAKGEKIERIRDADGGKIKTLNDHLIEGEEQKGKTFADRVGKKEAILPREKIKDPHLQSSTALTHPEEAKQNLKGADKARNIGKPTTPSRGGSFRGGGAPQIDEPDEILKKKSRALNPEDILSRQKGEKSFEVAVNAERNPETFGFQQQQKQQQQQGQHKSKNPQNEVIQKLSARERTDMAKAAKEKGVNQSGTIDMANEHIKMSIKERIANANARKEITPVKATVVTGKNKEVAMSKVKQLSPKTIKR